MINGWLNRFNDKLRIHSRLLAAVLQSPQNLVQKYDVKILIFQRGADSTALVAQRPVCQVEHSMVVQINEGLKPLSPVSLLDSREV